MFSRSMQKLIAAGPVMIVLLSVVTPAAITLAAEPPTADGNRLSYLDGFCDPYVFGVNSPRLTTPQWIGEPGVRLVVTLGIDDMRDVETYEAFLRPILDRLKKIDGRAPVSIFANAIDPKHPRLQQWLGEGLSIETHTANHPCPCLDAKGFDIAKSTYDRCVDQMSLIPHSRPVAFRFPCCDSKNTPSPRAFVELLGKSTPAGNFVQMSSSVCSILDAADPALPRSLVFNDQRQPRFSRYAPFPNFVNRVFNYPYPFVVAHTIWEMPIGVPDDWQGFHLQQAANPQTVTDLEEYAEAVGIKQGVVNVTFHPHGWIRNDQFVAFIDHVVKEQGKRVRFLNFKECLQRMNEHLLAGQPLRAADGSDNGVRLLDLNNDGFMDVVIGNDRLQRTRVWDPRGQKWIDGPLPVKIVGADAKGQVISNQVRFGVLDSSGLPIMLVRHEHASGAWRFDGRQWIADERLLAGLAVAGKPLSTGQDGRDRGVRMLDVDGDGRCELIVANPDQRGAFAWDDKKHTWHLLSFAPPEGMWIADAQGRDGGTRWADVDADGALDLMDACERGSGLFLFDTLKTGWNRLAFGAPVGSEKALPQFAPGGTNGGAWIADRQVWLQNEETARLPDGVFHRSFNEMLGSLESRPLDARAGLKSMHVPPGFRVELVAAEPLVMDPVAFDWGPDGKLWVAEMADYPLGLDGKGAPGGRVRYLEDTDGDGKFDKSTLFLDKISFPNGVMAWRDGVLVTAAPEVFFARDTDGDGKCDDRQVLFEGFKEGNQQHRINGLRWALDGWVHLANGDSGGKIRSRKTGKEVDISARDVRIRPDEGDIQTVTGWTQFGRDRDDFDHWFGLNNSHPGFQFLLDDLYLRRNPHVAPPSASVQFINPAPPLHPLSRTVTRFNYPESANHFTSACSGMVYRDDLLGAEVAGNYFVCEPVHNLVHREVLSREGLIFKAARAASELESEFLRSTDNWFRPVMARTGPDGALWVADMYRNIMEHPEWIPADVQAKVDLRAGHDKGRIYRVVPVEKPARPLERLDKLSTPDLVARLDSPGGTQRDRVQQIFLWRGDKSAAAALARLAGGAMRPAVRVQALWTLEGLGALSDSSIVAALADREPQVRAAAVRLAEPRLAGNAKLGAALLALVDDQYPDVLMQLAYTLGEWHDPKAGDALGQLTAKHQSDPYLEAALLGSVNQANLPAVLARLLATPAPAELPATKKPPATDLLPKFLSIAAALGNREALGKVVELIGTPVDGSFADWQNIAMSSALAELRRQQRALSDVLEPQALARLEAMFAAARKRTSDEDASNEAREAAVGLLAENGDPQDFQLLIALVNPRQPMEIQSATIRALARSARVETAERLLDGWATYSPALRAQVLDTLLSREIWTVPLLDRIDRGAIVASQIDATRRQRLTTTGSAANRARAEKLLSADSGPRAQVVEEHLSLLNLPADKVHGREVFLKRCAACHRLDGEGFTVGADLAAVGNKSPQALLIAILDPNRAVEDRYVTYLAQLDDGRQFSGVLAAESGDSLTLRLQEGKEQVVLRKQLEVLRNTGKSLMPEGLEKDVSDQDLADLIGYVSGTASPVKQFAGNEPRLVKAAADGSLQLRASAASIHGSTLVFEAKYQNLGFWMTTDDQAGWSVQIPAAGQYKVVFDYACENSTAGNSFWLQAGDQKLTGKVQGTDSWDKYRDAEIGTIRLSAGEQTLRVGVQAPLAHALFDLRTVRLMPVAK